MHTRFRLPLVPLVFLNLLLSVGHYADNVLRFVNYPEPVWMHAHQVDQFWFVLVAWLVPLFLAGRRGETRGALVSFCSATFFILTCLSLMHFNYMSFSEIPLRIHFFIFAQVLGAALLLPYAFSGGRRSSAPLPVLALTAVTAGSLAWLFAKALGHRELPASLEVGAALALFVACSAQVFPGVRRVSPAR